MSMKEAFEVFFEKNNDCWKRVMGTFPQVIKNNLNQNCNLFISEEDENSGMIQWQPKKQTDKVDFTSAEEVLGFEIHPQIKAFLNTYWFLELRGQTEEVHQIQLDPVLPTMNLVSLAKESFNVEGYSFNQEDDYFLLASFCEIDGDDGYSLLVANKTGKVYAVQPIEKKSQEIAESIEDLLLKMKGMWD